MKAEDLVKPGAVVVGIAAAAALGFAAGYLVAKDPALLRRLMRSLAGGVERLTGAVAESREELADLWAASRAGARDAIEDETFAAATASAAMAAASAVGKAATPAPAEVAPPAARRTRRAATKSPKARAATAPRPAARKRAATAPTPPQG
ncbi:MAG: hypothetical protein U5L03_12390 [Burkholderiaceae bacterium]|nr:hypothetical protein [Burkholderiaceae bacterium]